MANARSGFDLTDYPHLRYTTVTVDTDPGADGYYTNEVSRASKIWAFIDVCTGATVSLLFKSPGSSVWATYGDYTAVDIVAIDCHPDTRWKIGVADNNQGTTSTSRIAW